MTCRGCEQTRQFISNVWRKVARNRQTCVIKGCTGAYPLCRSHWRMLSISLRQRWWRDTNYDRDPPLQILIDEVNRVIEAQKAKPK